LSTPGTSSREPRRSISDTELTALLGHTTEAIVCIGDDVRITYASPGIRQLLGYDPESLVGQDLLGFLHPDEVEGLLASFERWAGREGQPLGQVQRALAVDGSWRKVHYDTAFGTSVAPFGAMVLTLRAADDVRPEVQELRQRELNERRLVRLASSFLHYPLEEFDRGLEDAVVELAGLDWVTRVSVWRIEGSRAIRRAFWEAPIDAPRLPLLDRIRIADWPAVNDLVAGHEVHVFSPQQPGLHPDDRRRMEEAGVRSLLAVPMRAAGSFSGFIMVEATMGERTLGAIHVTAVRSAAAILAEAFVRNDAELLLAEQLRTDPITGLGTRWAFDEVLADSLDGLSRDRSPGFAIAVLDIDRFRVVNDALGHEAGDLLLADIAIRLSGAAGPRTTLARLGGDQLLVLHDGEASLADAVARTEDLLDSLRQPFEVGERPVTVTASVGLVHAGDASADAVELLRRADLALKRAKEHGGDTIEVDDEHLRERVATRLHREADLRAAIEGDGIEVHYQGEWDLRSGALVAVEALARWRHPEEGLLAAGSFIPLAEESKVIGELGLRVLREACSALGSWRAAGRALDLVLRVNISARQLRSDGLAEQVSDALADAGVPPEALCLELTESSLLIDPEGSVARLEQLRSLGVGLAVDDFGTGYSSLQYLKRLPVTAVKIDRAFVKDLPEPPSDRAIVQAVVHLAEVLDLTCTAEGVETVEQRDALVRLGCYRAQGFLLARPEPTDAFAARLA
jgi:diguanylate cyclase (GGDEF)-like protein/PAS domain S-box-containing protein